MKTTFIYFFIFGFLMLKAQTKKNIDSLLSQKDLPDGLSVKTTHTVGDMGFPRKYIATATFEFKDASVDYTIFPYFASDSTAFGNALNEHWKMSGCNVIRNKDHTKNFHPFLKNNYYFLLEYCPCRTTENEVCAELAKRINKWTQKH